GVKPDGTDATNAVTFMMLQSAGRLLLHDPPQALRIHKGTPHELWEAAIETTKLAGGVPTFENDEIIIPALMSRGHTLESARNYCLIGCVEPAGCGNEWPACGGIGVDTYFNLANVLWLAINDGYNIMPGRYGEPPRKERCGLPTGYLYEMETFAEVLNAFRAQMEFFVKWFAGCINAFEYVARDVLPQPVVSATMDGCMEKGRDVMYGGATYNSTGIAGIAIGNVVSSLGIIKHCIFDKKICTARELHDALINNWEGYEDLHRYIRHEAPHYGNGIKEIDRYAKWVADIFAAAVNSCTGPRGRFSAGLYPVTTNVVFGKMTAATPDGRYRGEPLADGISPVQQMDKNGPTAILVSVANIDQSQYPNGTLLNMKFHPSSMQGEEGVTKLKNLIQTYFGMGGMEMQINVVSAETLRDAQKNPDNYKNLVVRVAGFSAYFVELHIDGQNDLIRRTELAM
ncbi:MAG TPA: glycyl radical protein, partial [Firmicutes bacterium]|nr:glycyl radical protein [Bacillota bacterium]